MNTTSLDPYLSVGPYWPGWITYICLLVPTFLLNTLTIALILYTPALRQKANPILVVYLAIEDALLSLFCLVSCIANLTTHSIYLKNVGCALQALYAVFFVISTGYSLCVISLQNYLRVKGDPGFTHRQIFYIHLAIWLVAAGVAGFSADGISTRPRVMPSGTYCLVSLQQLESGLVFYLPGVVSIGAFLLLVYTLMYRYIRTRMWRIHVIEEQSGSSPDPEMGWALPGPLGPSRGQSSPRHPQKGQPPSPRHPSESSERPSQLPSQPPSPTPQKALAVLGASPGGALGGSVLFGPSAHVTRRNSIVQPTLHHRIRAARKMFAFVVCYFLCALPVLVVSLYEVLAGTDAPGAAHLVAGHFVHLNSFLNPLLYFWTNPSARKAVLNW